MNFKKLKRLMCVLLSGTMILSTGMTGFAAETTQMGLVTEENEAPGKEALKDGLDANADSSSDRSNARAAVSPADLTVEGCTNHVVEAVKRQAPTCFTEGILAHYTCKNCNRLYKTRADALAGENPVTMDELKISKLNHAPEEVDAQDPTCTENGHIAYYTCNLCGERYATIENFYNDTNRLTDDQVIKNALGHSYTRDSQSTCMFVGVESLTPETYQEGDACGISASRTCSREDCDYEQHAVVSVQQDALAPGFDCTVPDSKLTYTVTAAFTDEDGEPSENGTPGQETTPCEYPVSEHNYGYTFDWDELELICADGILDYQGQVTAKRTCEYCKQDDTAAGNSVTATVALTQEGTQEPYTLKCIQEKSFKFTATAEFGSGVVETNDQYMDLPVGLHSNLTLKEGREATCQDPGWYEHFECGVCDKPCWDEETLAKDSEINIPALGHNIGLPTFRLTEDGLTAEATFKCIRGDVEIKKTETCVVDKSQPTYSVPSATCGNGVDITYPVTVTFDRKSIQQNDQGEWYEDTDPEHGYAPITYKGTVTETNVTLRHNFTAQPTWKGTPDGDGHRDPTQGATVTLTCGKCHATIILDSTSTVPSGTLANGVSANAGLTVGNSDPNLNGYQPATCVSHGVDVYPLTITGSTTDAAETNFGTTMLLTNVSLKTGHKYVVTDVTEGELDSSGNPTVTSMTVECANCEDVNLVYDDSNTSALNVTVTQVTTEDQYGYHPATCTEDGNKVWKLDVTVTGDNSSAYKEYTDDASVPWTIEKPDEKTGHLFASTVDSWDWSAYGTVADDGSFVPFDTEDGAQNPVYGVYECQHSNCDGVSDADTEPQETGTSYTTVDGTRVKKVAATVETSSTITDCTQSGNITHTAKIGSETDTKQEAVSGHKWGDVTWGQWTKVQDANGEPEKEFITVTVGDQQVSFEVYKYTITASRTCKVCSATEKFAEDADASNDIKDGITVTVGTTDINTCTKSGSTLYWASVDLEGDGNETKNLVPHVEVYKPLGHDYDIQWTWYGKTAANGDEVAVSAANEKDIIVYTSAQAAKVCTRCTKSVATAEGVVVKCDKTEEDIQCVETDVFFYTATAKFTDAPDEAYTGQKWIIHPGNGHDYEWIIPDWPADSAVEAGTYNNITINGSCQNNAKHTVTLSNATVTLEDDGIAFEKATCSTGETLVATGTFSGTDDEGKQYKGTCTYEQPAGRPVEGAHSYQPAVIDWSQGYLKDGEVNKEAGTVTYQVTAVATCEHNSEHTVDIPVVAVAQLSEVEKINCIHNFSINYTLSIEDDRYQEMSLFDGSSRQVTHTAGEHGKISRVEGKEGTCETAGYSTYYECETCHVTYSNRLATDAYETKVETIAPLGHRYGNPVYVWTDPGKEVSAIFTCTRSGCQENSKSGYNKTFIATIDTDSNGKPIVYVEKEAECVGTGVAGVSYYMVSLDLTQSSVNEDEFTKGLDYHGDVLVNVAAGDHQPDFADASICKWCKNTIDNMVTVTWTANGKTVDSKAYDKETVTETDIAEDLKGINTPSRSGYEFKGWSVGGADTSDQLAADILAKVQAGNPVTVTAMYEKKTDKVTVTVRYAQETAEGTARTLPTLGTKTYTGTVGTYVDLTIEEDVVTDGSLAFAYWANEAEVKLSTSQTYKLYITTAKDVTLYAVYAAKPTEDSPAPKAEPTIVMSDKYATAEGDKKKLSFVASMDLPEGYTGVQSGMIYCTDETVGADPARMVLGGASPVASKSFTSTDYKTNILTVGVTTKPDTQVYVRGYVICSNGNEQITVYSNIVHASYNELMPE